MVHQLQIGIKVFATRRKYHQEINVAVSVNQLITCERDEDGAACETNRPQDADIGAEPIQNIRAMGGRGYAPILTRSCPSGC